MSRRSKKNSHLKVLPGEGRKFSIKLFGQAFIFYLFLLLILLLLIQLGYHWLGEQFLAWRLQIVAAERGYMRQEKVVGGLITRREKVTTSPAGGEIVSLTSGSERIKAGTDIMVIRIIPLHENESTVDGEQENYNRSNIWDTIVSQWQHISGSDLSDTENQTLTEIRETESEQPSDKLDDRYYITLISDVSGFLSYHIDGWEHYQGPLYYEAESFPGPLLEEHEIKAGTIVRYGEPLYKIVDNWHWFYSIVLSVHPGQTLAGFDTVTIEFDFAPGTEVKAYLEQSEFDEDKQQVKLCYRVERQLPGFDRARWTGATLLFSQYYGTIIPGEAIFSKNGTKGVYLNQGGRVVFYPVIIKQQSGDKVMVEGISINSMVITRPDLVEEGQRLN